MEETLSTIERAVTISQVAALAGASTGTASTALNGRGALRPETRLRVQQAADQLGFVANAAARCLQTGRTHTVGMITTDTIGRISIPMLIGAEDALGAGPEHHHSASVRAAATIETLTTEGLHLATPSLYGEWSESWGRQAAGILLSAEAPIDAIFCGSAAGPTRPASTWTPRESAGRPWTCYSGPSTANRCTISAPGRAGWCPGTPLPYPSFAATADATPRPVPVEAAEQGVTIGVERTPGQDLGFGFRQLADIAGRALSPGINDVTTAVRAVQEAHDLLHRLATHPDPTHIVRDDGTVRSQMSSILYDTILAMIIGDIRLVSRQQPRVQRLLDSVVHDVATVALPVHHAAIRRRPLTTCPNILQLTSFRSSRLGSAPNRRNRTGSPARPAPHGGDARRRPARRTGCHPRKEPARHPHDRTHPGRFVPRSVVSAALTKRGDWASGACGLIPGPGDSHRG